MNRPRPVLINPGIQPTTRLTVERQTNIPIRETPIHQTNDGRTHENGRFTNRPYGAMSRTSTDTIDKQTIAPAFHPHNAVNTHVGAVREPPTTRNINPGIQPTTRLTVERRTSITIHETPIHQTNDDPNARNHTTHENRRFTNRPYGAMLRIPTA